MRKSVFTILAAIIFTFCCCGKKQLPTRDKYAFDGVMFGMSQLQVNGVKGDIIKPIGDGFYNGGKVYTIKELKSNGDYVFFDTSFGIDSIIGLYTMVLRGKASKIELTSTLKEIVRELNDDNIGAVIYLQNLDKLDIHAVDNKDSKPTIVGKWQLKDKITELETTYFDNFEVGKDYFSISIRTYNKKMITEVKNRLRKL